jgi:hypothetical protein
MSDIRNSCTVLEYEYLYGSLVSVISVLLKKQNTERNFCSCKILTRLLAYITVYGMTFWGNAPNSINISELKRTNSKKMDSCRELFKPMKILPFHSQYIFSLLLCIVNNKQLLTKNSEIHYHNTRSINNFYVPITNLTKYQRGTRYSVIKIFNHLPTHINCVANDVQVFKPALKEVSSFQVILFCGGIF